MLEIIASVSTFVLIYDFAVDVYDKAVRQHHCQWRLCRDILVDLFLFIFPIVTVWILYYNAR